MQLSVVLVNYQMRAALLDCLDSLQRDAASAAIPDWESVVVDNASSDGSREAAAARFPHTRWLQSPTNEGYARAVNRGLAATTGRFALVMNPDCVVLPGALCAMMEHLEAHAETAVVGPQILDSGGKVEYSCRSFPTPYTFLFNRYSLLTRLFPRNRWSRDYLLLDWDHSTTREVDWVSGACMMVRREAARQVGPMDEYFFMFNEDVDWCRRFKQAGWQVTYVPAARVVHHIGASRGKVASKVIVERHRGMIHYFHKHHPMPAPLAWLANGFIMLRAGLMVAANALRPR
jgi:GT2 family glycosyltransferase